MFTGYLYLFNFCTGWCLRLRKSDIFIGIKNQPMGLCRTFCHMVN